jgi:outer membrane lipoprotein-sorting protein
MAVQRVRSLAAAVLMLALVGIGPRISGIPAARGSHVDLFDHADLFDELYRRGQKQNGDLRTLTAAFTETTTSSLLTRPLIARGTVAVERPSGVALRYSAPDDRVVMISGGRMTLSWPSRGLQQSKDVGATLRRVQKYFVDSSPDELRSHFQVTAQETDDHRGYLVILVPKRKQIKEGLSRLELWIDPDTLLLSEMRMSFPNGDTKLMTYTDVKTNVPVDGLFK